MRSENEQSDACRLLLLLFCAGFAIAEEGAGVAAADELSRGLVLQRERVDQPEQVSVADLATSGDRPFSLALWVNVPASSQLATGDLISQYDPALRRGFQLGLKTNSGVTSNQANDRHLQFGIDNNQESEWIDCGRPGNAVFAFSMAVHNGQLFAGTCEAGPDESGHVYRFAGGSKWVDCGSPDRSNAVTAMAVYGSELYVGTGKYRLGGSSLQESENLTLGGRVFRYAGGMEWVDCGQLLSTEAVGGMVVSDGRLYASSLYKPAGFFRYEGAQRWTALPVPMSTNAETQTAEPRRVVPLALHRGRIYAGSYDGGRVYRFDGESWEDCGQLGENTQTYSFAELGGQLHVSTWPSGRVYRFGGVNEWIDTGRLGEELEVMGMVVHNGRLIAGTLPLAEVYTYEGGSEWRRMTQLDQTPDVRYRRVWTMAEHDGRLFASTLPSGHIHAYSAGVQAQWGQTMPAGWHHIAAVRLADRLRLYVDGMQVAESEQFSGMDYQLDLSLPLRLASGVNGPFAGELRDLRIYQRALSGDEVKMLGR